MTTNLSLEEKSNGGPTIKLENKSLVPVLSQEYLSMKLSPIDFIVGDEWRIVRDCDLMVQIPHMMYPTAQLHIQTQFGSKIKTCVMLGVFKMSAQAEAQPSDQKFI